MLTFKIPAALGQLQPSPPQGTEVTVDALMQRMKKLSEKSTECTEMELSNRFKHVEMQAAELPAASSVLRVDGQGEVPQQIGRFVDDPNFTYQDFARRGAENIPQTFRIQDYSWDDHGYSLVNRLVEVMLFYHNLHYVESDQTFFTNKKMYKN